MEILAELFHRGGGLLWAIYLVSVLLVALILERWWFLFRELPSWREELLTEWHRFRRLEGKARRIAYRAFLVCFEERLGRALPVMEGAATVLPLLGLLGTVGGMIKVFDAMALFGSGNPRAMAMGISEALITTLAGLTTAIVGIFLLNRLSSRLEAIRNHFALELSTGGGSERRPSPGRPIDR